MADIYRIADADGLAKAWAAWEDLQWTLDGADLTREQYERLYAQQIAIEKAVEDYERQTGMRS